MNFLLQVDKIDEDGYLNLEDKEIQNLINWMFGFVMDSFFGRSDTVADEEGMYTSNLYPVGVCELFLKSNPQLVNEALYNVTMDEESREKVNEALVRDRNKVKPWEKLESEQFKDPYINIAYQIAKEFQIQPSKVINEWGTSELVVMFANISNEKSLSAHIQFRQSQSKEKATAPKKQAWYFDDVLGSEEDEGDIWTN